MKRITVAKATLLYTITESPTMNASESPFKLVIDPSVTIDSLIAETTDVPHSTVAAATPNWLDLRTHRTFKKLERLVIREKASVAEHITYLRLRASRRRWIKSPQKWPELKSIKVEPHITATDVASVAPHIR